MHIGKYLDPKNIGLGLAVLGAAVACGSDSQSIKSNPVIPM